MESILTSIKKLLGIMEEDDQFDMDVIIHINTIFSVLTQLGIGPEDGFSISDEQTTWIDFLGSSKNVELVKTYVYLRVRVLFDPPQNSFLVDAMERNAKELEWRLSIID